MQDYFSILWATWPLTLAKKWHFHNIVNVKTVVQLYEELCVHLTSKEQSVRQLKVSDKM